MNREVKAAIRDTALELVTICAAWYIGWMAGVQAGAKWIFDVIFHVATG